MILYDTPRLVQFRGRDMSSSHIMSDIVDLEEARRELDRFAISIGMRLDWRQNAGTPTMHYDLLGKERIARAADAGAFLVPPREIVERCVKPKRAAQKVTP